MQHSIIHYVYNIVNIKMATPERFELPTLKVEASCSIQLSYEAINLVRLVGLEPTRLTPTDFKSVVYTDSTTVAKMVGYARFELATPCSQSRCTTRLC